MKKRADTAGAAVCWPVAVSSPAGPIKAMAATTALRLIREPPAGQLYIKANREAEGAGERLA